MNNFELISKLGEGSYSTVYKVRRKADLKMYALKKVKLKNLSEKEKQNALNEIRILASIKSDHIIAYKEAFIEEKEKILCLVTEFANKGDLFQKITYFKQMQKSFEEKDIWNIFIQILKGLKCLHDHNILHRDLKSANIFLFNNNLAKIGDLNVSKVTKNGIGHTQTGTPYYASPEVWNDESYTNKSDIWSLGCVLYEMICLTPPFKAESMDGLYHKIIKGKYNKIPEKYSKELNEILKLLFNVNPKERPSCDELLKNSIIKNKIEFFEENNKFNDDINNNEESELLKTIKISKNLLFLSGRLPKANYNNENEANNIKTLDNNKLLIKSITSINEEKKDYILPTIKLKNIQMLKKNIKLKKLNVFTEPTINKNEENIIKNKNKNLILNSSPNKITQSN
jgi:NIMA (never in mitosis gene a)-related kinase